MIKELWKRWTILDLITDGLKRLFLVTVYAISIGGVYSLHLHQDISSLKLKMARIDYSIAIFFTSTTLKLYGLKIGATTHSWK
jgi:hypothetical protein